MKNASVFLVVSVLTLSVLQNAYGFSGQGSGTQQDAYVITDVYQLQEMNEELDAWYELGKNIDASPTKTWNEDPGNPGTYFGFLPIGNIFTGHFNGKGYSITDLYINRNYAALFGSIGGGEVKNVGLVEADIISSGSAAGLVVSNSSGTITNCYLTGRVNSNGAASGLVGSNGGTIGNSHSTASVQSGAWGTYGYYVGGLVWHNGIGGTITSCSATGNVSGYCTIGGLVANNSGIITNCYATGSVSGRFQVGGLVGWNSDIITNCYCIGPVSGRFDTGGLVGYNNSGTCNNSFWDIHTSGQTTSACGTGKTTAQMNQQATFTNWDFVNTWDIVEGLTYPFLRSIEEIGLQIWSADAIGAGILHKQGITGRGVRVGSIEAVEADKNHEVFAPSRLTNLTHLLVPPGDLRHATEVAGVTGGKSLSYIGMAPGTHLTVDNLGPFASLSLVAGIEELAETEDVVNIEIATGAITNPSDGMDPSELAADWAVKNKGVTIVVPGGNHSMTIEVPAGGYNNITVGGTEDFRENPGQESDPRPLSARKYTNGNYGPTEDRRCKPDIVAPAVGINVPLPDNTYGVDNGTSFAAPHVAGAAALLIEQGRKDGWTTDPKLIKALLMTGTVKPVAWARSATLVRDAYDTYLYTNQPLDYELGSGLVNVAKASDIFATGEQPMGSPVGNTHRSGWDDGHVDEINTPAIYFLGPDPIKPDSIISATLVWNRNVQKGLLGYSGENPDTVGLVLSHCNGDTWSKVAHSFSVVDNIQHIFYRVPYNAEADTYRLEVCYGNDKDSIPGCDYVVAWYTEVSERSAIENGFFSLGGFNGWTPSGIGMTEVVERPLCDGDPYAVRLTVGDGGTYVELSQVVAPLNFTDGVLEFSYMFPPSYNSSDMVKVFCNGQFLDYFAAPGIDPNRMSYGGVPLHFNTLGATPHIAFALVGNPGATVLIDNIQLSPLAETVFTNGDINNDGYVDFIDYAILANQWLKAPSFPSADIAPSPNGDGVVNYLDLSELAGHWLEGAIP